MSEANAVTVWCPFWSGGAIDPFFFENEEGANVTVNGERCPEMLSDWFFDEIEAENVDNFWIQQGCGTSHTANVTINMSRLSSEIV